MKILIIKNRKLLAIYSLERYRLLLNTEIQFVPNETGLRLAVSLTSRSAEIDALYGRKRFDRGTDALMAFLRE